MMSQTASTVNLPVNLAVSFTGSAIENTPKPSSCLASPRTTMPAHMRYASGYASHPSVRFILKGAHKRRTLAYRRAREIQMELGLIEMPRPTGVSR